MRVLETKFCERCQCDREFNKRIASHRWHLGLTVVTFGLWGVGWLAVTVAEARRPWRCSICRSRYVPDSKIGPNTPNPDVDVTEPKPGRLASDYGACRIGVSSGTVGRPRTGMTRRWQPTGVNFANPVK